MFRRCSASTAIRVELVLLCLLLSGCGDSGAMFTLYRGSATDPATRMHVSSFDADTSAAYNEQSCLLAKEHFEKQNTKGLRYWCEPGPYRS